MTPQKTGLLITFCATGFAYVAIAQQPPRQLTARELFYSASASARPTVPTPQSPPPTPPPVASKKRPAASLAKTTPSVIAPGPKPVNSAPAPSGSTASLPSAPIIETVDRPAITPTPIAGTPLGLKYTILKKAGDDMIEVPANTVFRSGDRIRFKVETNTAGYLYIINQGTSGTWKPMFPSPEIEDGNNRVEGWRPYTMPPRNNLVFNEQTGTEKIFIVFSREPEVDLENVIYSLQNGSSKPVTTPVDAPATRQMVQFARLNIDNATVGRLRQVYARDLIIERVDPSTPGERKETAVYVVNPSGSTSSRVVADLPLEHR